MVLSFFFFRQDHLHLQESTKGTIRIKTRALNAIPNTSRYVKIEGQSKMAPAEKRIP